MSAVAVTFAFSTATAEAKCGFRSYRVEVEFRSLTGVPVSGVQLAVFADGADRELPLNNQSASNAPSGDDGRLVRTYWFNTYSGSGIFATDRCNGKLRTLELVVMHPDYRAQRISIKKLQIRTNAASDVWTVVIPPVLMDPLTP